MNARRLIAAVGLGIVGLAACGSDDSASPAPTAPATAAPSDGNGEAPAGAKSTLPNVDVVRVNGDRETINFNSIAPADKPILLWFYAPH